MYRCIDCLDGFVSVLRISYASSTDCMGLHMVLGSGAGVRIAIWLKSWLGSSHTMSISLLQ